jgi:hypothetical protein
MHVGALSSAFVHAPTAKVLRAAIAAVTRTLAIAHEHEQVLELVRERAALRHELWTLARNAKDEPEERVA